jgi:hypothetical protein
MKVGEGQPGVTTVFFDHEKKASRQKVSRLPLGDGAEIRGKILVVSTTVVDLLKEHDRTSVTLVLANGTEQKFPDSEEATDSGLVNYLFAIRLV